VTAPCCPHSADAHDLDWFDTPACRAVGCFCGHPNPDLSYRLDMALARQRVDLAIARMAPVRLGWINPC
jgi:hypothetical protein